VTPFRPGSVAAAAFLVSIALVACSLSADNERGAGAARPTWVDAWSAAPAGPVPERCGGIEPVAALPRGVARSQTLRMVVRPSVAGDAIKVRLTNRYGDTPLHISHVTVARQTSGMTVAGPVRDVLFDGLRATSIAAGEELESDAVRLAVDPDDPITVSIAVASGEPLTWHWTTTDARATRPGVGDQTASLTGRQFTTSLNGYVALAGIAVRTDEPITAIAALGDSLTEDASLAPDNTWLEVLGTRLERAGAPHAILNGGIGCNALLRDVSGGGERASGRLDPDVLARTNVKYVIVFIGANDYPSGVAADDMIEALTDIAGRAQSRGLKVFAATVFPKNSASANQHAARNAVNSWIRKNSVFDGVIDFDRVIRAPSNPNQINPRYNGDGLHVNDRGQRAMGNAIPLRVFTDTGD